MAEEVTKTIENVDCLFSEIVVNGEVHESQNYVPPVTIEQTPPAPVVEEDDTPSTPSEQNTQGEDVYAVELNEILHPFVDQEATQDLRAETLARQQADNALQQSVSTIQGLIPSQASSENKLADKDFVNSSIATNTANFIGTFESVTELQAYAGDVTNNDYAFVVNEVIQYNGSDFPDVTTLNNYDKTTLTNGDYAWVVNAEDNTKYDLYRFDIVEQSWVLRNTKIGKSAGVLNNFFNRYKATVSDSTVTWLYEYTLNNSSFTAEQWSTINSGLTQNSVDQDIQDAINSLDVASQGGNGKYIKSIEQVNGEISATEGSIDSTPTQNSSNPVTSGGVYDALQNAGGGGSSLDLQGTTYASNTYDDNNPKIRFKNEDASQDISLTFTDYDAVQSPASLTLNGNQGGEYFIAPNIKVTGKVYGRVNLSSTTGTENGDIWVV